MKTENKNNYYNDEDKINFDKLNNFRRFNSNIKDNIQSENHDIKYANSDKNYFNNIIKTEEDLPIFKKKDDESEVKYYNSSDYQKFNQFNNFFEYKNNTAQEQSTNINSELSYSSNDYGEFNKIIPTKNIENKIINNKNQKVKIIDYNNLKDDKKKIKNKLGIEKIKIVYFD